MEESIKKKKKRRPHSEVYPAPGFKSCSRCEKVFPLYHFQGDRSDYLRAYCRRCHAELATEFQQNFPDKYAQHHRKVKNGISKEEYETLLVKQNYVCAICGEDDPVYKLSVDHDAITGQIRGLLCKQCNLGIGIFKHSVKRLRDATLYIYNAKKTSNQN